MFQENKKHLQKNLFNTETTMNNTRKLVLKNGWSEKFYENIFLSIDEKSFEGLYKESLGRPNFPVNILVGLEILKETFTLTDEQLYENYHFNYLYQKALGVEDINEYSFSIRTLYNFRFSLGQYENKTGMDLFSKIFKNGRDKIISELGLKTGLQRTDSVMIGANIKRMSRFTLFHKILSNLVKELIKQNEIVSEELKELVNEEEDSAYYKLNRNQVDEKLKTLSKFLYIHVERWKTDERINNTDAYLNACRLIEEQCKIINSTKIELKEPKEIQSGSLQNPADPDATHKRKMEEDFRGYSVHGVETCDSSNPIQVITSVETVKNNVDDAKVLSVSIPKLKEETNIDTIITDGGYVSEDVRQKCEEHKIDFIATSIRGKEQSEDKINSLSFEIGENKLIEKCPNGERPIKQKLKEDGTLIATFDSKKCITCPLRDKCIAFQSKKQSRLVINTKRRWLDERRAKQTSEEYQSLCKLRPAVEGLMEKLKPKYLRGRTLFRGLSKVRNRMTLRAIGLNFKRYWAWILDILSVFINLIETHSQKRNFIFSWVLI